MFYEKFADSYDDMINWDRRLELEADDLKTLIKEKNIKSLVDAGCGTGMHYMIFKKLLNLDVIGVDNNETMLNHARRNIKKHGIKDPDLIKGDFLKLSKIIKKQVDCVACLGNSLPHLVDDADITAALKEFYNTLKPGGLLILQIVHFDHYLDSADSAVAVTDGVRKGRDVTFRRHYEFKGTKVVFHVSIYDREKRELVENYASPLNAIRKDLLQNFMAKVGFKNIQMYRDFGLEPIRDVDRSLVILANRPEEE